MSLTKLGRYDLIRVLGKGAMGLVYEGRDPNLERRVAIKTIRVENLSVEAAAEYEVRFRTEARSAARLQHPNIVSVYDSDRDGDTAFLVMEFIQGDDLKYHLDRGERYSLQQTLAIMSDLLSALDYAHRHGIVHRDIKPANLLIEPGGRVKLTDFGVARIHDSGDATRTQGTMVGTLKYMSPEQVQGLPVDARADLFAAGIVLYQLLTGKRPFDGETDFAIIQQIVGYAPAAPTSFNSQLPPAIDAVMARALVKSRDQRFATAQEFSLALQAASQDAADPTVVSPSSPVRPGSSSTWTGTMRDSELLVGLQSGNHAGISVVTQELELVYWKDIKDSNDVEDLQVFLAKFPHGIYATLARRRLRMLGVLAGEDTDIATAVAVASTTATDTLVMPRSVSQLEKTVLLSRISSPAETEASSGPVDLSWMAPELADVQVQTSLPVLAAALAGAAPAPAAAPSALFDATVLLPVQAGVLPETPAIPQTRPSQPSTMPEVVPPQRAVSRWLTRRLSWALASVVALVGVGLGLGLSDPSVAPPPTVPALAAISAPGTADASATALPALTPSASLTTPQADAALPVAARAAVPVVVADTLAAATGAAPKAAALTAAKKSASDKDKPVKAAPSTVAINAVPQAAARAPAAPAVPDEAVALAAPRSAAATNPRQACEDRILIGFQICMAEQCAKPAFSRHPVCLERLAMEQRRRDAEQSLR
ncbi:serine/threonine-protein kinase [Polaromonas sp.]|uniref:serine/threonine-protein kinase n=1 Tax=Polaromonas sp. TaxID=1869339 RepID=UPI0017E7766D|nr:serine/threonine-protein kinase [Polaromonas sp.]NMM08193.1 serine/threonine protein kinase [Polaromonas sp.]